MQVKYYNLTNGLEWLPFEAADRIIRLPSTVCETKDLNYFLTFVDGDLLFNLASGHDCIIYDASRKKRFTRTQRQGLEYLKYCLKRIWKIKPDVIVAREQVKFFEEQYRLMPRKIKNRLRYFKRWYIGNNIFLVYKCKPSKYDGDLKALQNYYYSGGFLC